MTFCRGRWPVDRFNSLHHDGSGIAREATTDDLFLLGAFALVVIGLLIAAYLFLPAA